MWSKGIATAAIVALLFTLSACGGSSSVSTKNDIASAFNPPQGNDLQSLFKQSNYWSNEVITYAEGYSRVIQKEANRQKFEPVNADEYKDGIKQFDYMLYVLGQLNNTEVLIQQATGVSSSRVSLKLGTAASAVPSNEFTIDVCESSLFEFIPLVNFGCEGKKAYIESEALNAEIQKQTEKFSADTGVQTCGIINFYGGCQGDPILSRYCYLLNKQGKADSKCGTGVLSSPQDPCVQHNLTSDQCSKLDDIITLNHNKGKIDSEMLGSFGMEIISTVGNAAVKKLIKTAGGSAEVALGVYEKGELVVAGVEDAVNYDNIIIGSTEECNSEGVHSPKCSTYLSKSQRPEYNDIPHGTWNLGTHFYNQARSFIKGIPIVNGNTTHVKMRLIPISQANATNVVESSITPIDIQILPPPTPTPTPTPTGSCTPPGVYVPSSGSCWWPPAPTPTAPNTPSAPTATATGQTSINISWTAPSGGTVATALYSLWRSTASAGTYTQIYCAAGTAYTDSGVHLSPGTPYYYKVRAGATNADCSIPSDNRWSGYSVAGSATTTGGGAATYTVTKTADTNDGVCDADCSLREAISASNASAGGGTINIPAGTYTITIAGTGENLNATGDFDIRKSVSIVGAGAGSTIIDGGGLDQVFHITGAYTVSISGVTITGATVPGAGGPIYNSGTLTVTNSIISNNSGGIYNAAGGTVNVTNSTISGNTAGFDGGGIYNDAGGTVNVTNSTISANSASSGGGIANYGTVTVTNSTISGNTATNGGGGIDSVNGGSLTVVNSTITSNTAATSGGGIYNVGTVTVTNSTITGNTAGWYGGGIYNNVGTVTVTNSTIVRNIAPAGQAGGISNGTNIFTNSIVADNGVGLDCGPVGTITDNGGNIDSDGTCGTFTQNAAMVQGTGFSALASNGGPTQTHALLGGSAAINTAPTCAGLTTDQRGYIRVAPCDIGAFEFGAVP
jgi:CSLREA domain-containing protein